MAFRALNPSLYRRLERAFGHVRVSGNGEAMIYSMSRDLDDKLRLNIQHRGEYYAVCCPWCHDTRFRLYVNHMFGQRDETNRRMLQLAHCFNEDCLADDGHWDDFLDRLDDLELDGFQVTPGRVVPEEAREVALPGACKPLHELPSNHPARLYLEIDRGFDSEWLSKQFGLSYCEHSHYNFARNRIIIPVFDGGKLKGWQARYIGELPWKHPDPDIRRAQAPKYFSCPGSHFRSQCIYNFDEMKNWETGVIVEGPTDTMRFGEMSGCLFGNTMTDYQRRRFFAIFRRRSAVILVDPEEVEKAATQRLIATFQKEMPNNSCIVKLPDGTDPGSLDPDFSRAYVQQEAAKVGVEVRYERIAA